VRRLGKNAASTTPAKRWLERQRAHQVYRCVRQKDYASVRVVQYMAGSSPFGQTQTSASLTVHQAFREALRGSVRGQPESAWVESDSFEVLDEDNGAALITPAKWEATISPGKILSMAMLLRKQGEMSRATEQECPTCQTAYRGFDKHKDLARLRW